MTNKFYQWWKNHRRVVTFGGFLILLGMYISPVIKEAKYKNMCIKLSEKGALNKFNGDNIGEILLKDTGLSIKELAKIEGYKNCL
ncbi:Notch domain-containing protein [Prochlorococcus sp. AH-716-G10]|nr:Notch domain-containing protein [Prochlorococcus sp. AH-716-G10]